VGDKATHGCFGNTVSTSTSNVFPHFKTKPEQNHLLKDTTDVPEESKLRSFLSRFRFW
jgi:hypothetical protein